MDDARARSAILAVLAVIGGWIQFAPFWHPLTNWLDAGRAHARRSRSRRTAQEALSSVLAVALGLAGHRGRLGDLRHRPRSPCRAAARVQRALEHKLYFDEAYDAVFYRPAAALATSAARATSRSPSSSRPAPTSARPRSTPAARRPPPPDRPAAHVRLLPRHRHGRARDRLPAGAMTVSRLHLAPHLAADRRGDRRVGAAALALRDRRARGARLAARGRHLDRAG